MFFFISYLWSEERKWAYVFRIETGKYPQIHVYLSPPRLSATANTCSLSSARTPTLKIAIKKICWVYSCRRRVFTINACTCTEFDCLQLIQRMMFNFYTLKEQTWSEGVFVLYLNATNNADTVSNKKVLGTARKMLLATRKRLIMKKGGLEN